MNEIRYAVRASTRRTLDSAVVLPGEDPQDALVQAVIGTISLDVEVQVGDVKMHLAAWMDYGHWADDWAAVGIEDEDAFDALLAGAVVDG